MKKHLKFAIVGCGVISDCHARCLSELDNAQLVAVCDIVEEKAQKLAADYSTFFNSQVYTDYIEMCKDPAIDIVIVTTPSGLHAEIGIAAARAGKHVLVEKPMDVTLTQADALISACDQMGVKLGVIFQHRFDDAVMDLKKAVADGKLGKLNFCGSYTQWYRSQGYYESGDWRGTWALDGGGALMNQSIHYVDLMQYVMEETAGPVTEIYAQTAILAHERIEVEDIAVATVKFASGALGTLQGMTMAYPGFCARLEVFGDEGGIVIENDQIKDWQLASREKYHRPTQAKHLIVGTSSHDIWHHAHRRQIADFMEAVWNDRPPLCTGRDGRKALEIVLAVYESARAGKPIKLPLSA